MIDLVTTDTVQGLAACSQYPSVSIFLPTHRTGSDKAQDPIRLANLLGAAHAELVASGPDAIGLRPSEADLILAPITELVDDGPFWAECDESLAVFASPDGVEVFRLPVAVGELVSVSDHFHITPLVRAVSAGEGFHILALSESKVRLLWADRFRVTEMTLAGLPEGVTDVVGYESRDRQLQYHAASRVGSGRMTATFHGHAMDKDRPGDDRLRFFRAIDAEVGPVLGLPQRPVVLAGVEHLVAEYRQTSRLANVVDGYVAGNPERLSPGELHERAWPLVSGRFERERLDAVARFEGGRGTGGSPGTSLTEIADVLAAAHGGRVAECFVGRDQHLWGVFDPLTYEVQVHGEQMPGARDLLDVAATLTLVHGGSVYVMEPGAVPGSGLVAATLRY